MSTSRRGFVRNLATGVAGISLLDALPSDLKAQPAGAWDTSWAARIKGKHKAVFDCTEPESGYGVWRANAWFGQYMDVMKVAAADLSPVLVLRHNAIVLALQHAFVKKYALGKKFGVTHPLTAAAIEQNPALACNLALQDVVDAVTAADKVAEPEARKRAIAGMVPGVILQPSGVFAVVRAQEAGCAYVKAS